MMSAKFGTLAGTIWLKSSRMKYQFLITALLRTPAMFTRIRNMSVMKRKKEVVSAHILRVRVARLICSLLSSGTTVGDVVCETAVSSDLRRREKMPIVGDSEVFQCVQGEASAAAENSKRSKWTANDGKLETNDERRISETLRR